MASIYRGEVCGDCHGEGRIERCEECNGNGTLPCDLCGGDGVRNLHMEGSAKSVPCICKTGFFSCARCSGGTGVCGRCAGTGFLEGRTSPGR